MKPEPFLRYIVDIPLLLMSEVPEINIPVTDEARCIMHAIAGQESNWDARRQGGGGPARSYWQFEGMGGGTGEVLQKFPRQMEFVCNALDIPYDGNTVF